MRKFFIPLVLALLFSACNSDYVNVDVDDYHYSVDIPKSLVVTTETEGSTNLIIYSVDKEPDGLANCIELRGDWGGEGQFTPEYVRSQFEMWSDVRDKSSLVSRECNDQDFSFTTKDEKYTRIAKYIYHKNNAAIITICYDKEHEDIFTDEVIEHVLSSVEF